MRLSPSTPSGPEASTSTVMPSSFGSLNAAARASAVAMSSGTPDTHEPGQRDRAVLPAGAEHPASARPATRTLAPMASRTLRVRR